MVHKNSGLPLHPDLPPADELPWTISYIIKKRTQIDSFNELPKDKRPPDDILWYGTPEELDIWFDKVLDRNYEDPQKAVILEISEDEIG
ncbi:MAG: hypothetical protein ACXADH_14300 [Candidatus Kariarchaeaceae archaeon]|jgi:hypothetical protein